MENTITITLGEYRDLIRKAERLAVIERMAKRSRIYDEDVKTALDIRDSAIGEE